ncbi:MAG: dTDP-4-dehydrorhamnose 3,5-epimerase [Acidobacteria bacterium]|nr:dTDP-4-dehydrorhamnose 3,5-epimerase [Acidobacteriota bacterium]
MEIRPSRIPDVLIVAPRVFRDARGYLLEVWNQARYAGRGMPPTFVQDNVSRSVRGVLRGLHLQHPHGQGKLVQVLDGEVFDVAVDVRVGSPTFGQWVGERLSGENHRQLYVPAGFAHGFCVLSQSALVSYKVTAPYCPEAEFGIAWNDPSLGISWPIGTPVVSTKDASAPHLSDIPLERLPRWSPGAVD